MLPRRHSDNPAYCVTGVPYVAPALNVPKVVGSILPISGMSYYILFITSCQSFLAYIILSFQIPFVFFSMRDNFDLRKWSII